MRERVGGSAKRQAHRWECQLSVPIGRARFSWEMNLVGDMARPLHLFARRPLVWSANYWTRCFGCRLVGRSHPHGATLTKERLVLSRHNARAAGRKTTR